MRQCYKGLLKGLYIVFVVLFTAACTDEPIMQQAVDVVEDVPTTIRLNLTMPESEKITVTRANNEIDNEAVFYDLYIFIFNSEGVLKTKRYWDFRQSPVTNGQYQIDDLQTTSGVSYIYGFANVGDQGRPSEYSGEVKTQLDNAEVGVFKREDLKGLTVSLRSKNTDIVRRTAATSLLAGKYVSGSGDNGWDDQGEGYCIIQPSSSTVQLSGRVELHSLDARITFKLIVGDAVTTPSSGAAYAPSFTATSYQVMNLPMKSRLLNEAADWDTADPHPQDGGAADYYSMEDENITIYETIEEGEGDKAKQYQTFYFYMPENRKSPKKTLTQYAEREKQFKNGTGDANRVTNGDWEYAPTYGTYVIISGVFRGYTEENNEVKPLEANVTYKIHLGNFGKSTDSGGNFNDFNTNRNTNYIYTVKVNGVDNIIVEVEDGNEEKQPGATGEVYFTDETDLYTLDAHYETCLMHFSYAELYGRSADLINYTVHTPFTNLGADKSEDANWVRFAINTKDDGGNYSLDLQNYETCGELMTVDELIELLKEMQNDENHAKWDNDNDLYVTCFVNEYYYTNDEYELELLSKGATTDLLAEDIQGQYKTPVPIENNVPAWKYAVNQPNRTLMLLTNIRSSNDGESSIVDAAYVISQRSIQTFYNTNPDLTGLTSALGIETINETGYLPMGDPSIYPSNLRDGLSNTLSMWRISSNSSISWDDYIDYAKNGYTVANTSQTDISVDYIGVRSRNAYLGCMQRNRDTNRNGRIDEEEVRWYMPALNQYAAFFMGAAALSQESRFYRYPNWQLKHFYSSTYRDDGAGNVMTVWAEEGFSTSTASEADTWYFDPEIKTRYYRCVRNLGNITKHENYVRDVRTPQNYWRPAGQGNNGRYSKFYFDYLSPSAVRQNPVVGSELSGTHTEQSQTNRVYWGFEVAPTDTRSTRIRETNAHAAITDCYSYTPNGEPEGTWRVPNQRELLFMLLNGNKGTGYVNFPIQDWSTANDGAFYFSRTLFTWGIVAARENNTDYYTPLKRHPDSDNGNTADKRRYGYYTTYTGNMSLSNQTVNNPPESSFLQGYIRCVCDIEIE